jgi:1-deoxy-D-xylulose-5-phosphate reductoisomerase
VRNLVILGSTGSIGRNALDIVDRNPGKFRVVGLSANRNAELLAEQIHKFNPPYAVLNDGAGLSLLSQSVGSTKTQVMGAEGIADLCSNPEVDTVLNAIVGFAGLKPTVMALSAGKRVALANKESMVAAGPLLNKIAGNNGGEIIPVDSEHSAIFQCLKSGNKNEVGRLILTSSGGPFFRRENLAGITPEEALKHPTWNMGPKITIDSATLMNKGLEIIEAAYLFGMPPEKISVVIHPQSIIHSMVEYIDGSIIAQMSKPDMRLPIQYALFYPERVNLDIGQIDFAKLSTLEFYPPPLEKFRSLELAYRVVKEGGIRPAVYNAANEQAVAAFLANEIEFTQIFEVVEKTLDKIGRAGADNLEAIFVANERSSTLARKIVENIKDIAQH